MRIECEHDRRTADLFCAALQSLDEPRVADVDAVKISDGDRAAHEGCIEVR